MSRKKFCASHFASSRKPIFYAHKSCGHSSLSVLDGLVHIDKFLSDDLGSQENVLDGLFCISSYSLGESLSTVRSDLRTKHKMKLRSDVNGGVSLCSQESLKLQSINLESYECTPRLGECADAQYDCDCPLTPTKELDGHQPELCKSLFPYIGKIPAKSVLLLKSMEEFSTHKQAVQSVSRPTVSEETRNKLWKLIKSDG